jgi:outer membrane lipoprotein-sorting protein
LNCLKRLGSRFRGNDELGGRSDSLVASERQGPAAAGGRAPLGSRLRRLALACALALPPAAAGAAPPAAAKLGSADQADLARIEDYLNGIKTLQARFLQVSSTGKIAEGDFYLQRPGRLRIEYDPPVPILIVADGRWLVYFDKELEQVTYAGLDSTPAGLLVREKVSFSGGGMTVTGFERGAAAFRVAVQRTEDPGEGSLTLVFSDRPLQLRKWAVTDAQGTTTTVSLVSPRADVALKPELFQFTPPPPKGRD